MLKNNKWTELHRLFESPTKALDTSKMMNNLLEFEQKTGITLPVEYKNYASLFGCSIFANEISIYCPPKLEYSISRIERFYYHFDSNLKWQTSSALVFGGTGCADVFFWDLKSWNGSDNSYDIYHFNCDDLEQESDIRIVGRCFYIFFTEFVINNKLFEKFEEQWLIPKEMYELKYEYL